MNISKLFAVVDYCLHAVSTFCHPSSVLKRYKIKKKLTIDPVLILSSIVACLRRQFKFSAISKRPLNYPHMPWSWTTYSWRPLQWQGDDENTTCSSGLLYSGQNCFLNNIGRTHFCRNAIFYITYLPLSFYRFKNRGKFNKKK